MFRNRRTLKFCTSPTKAISPEKGPQLATVIIFDFLGATMAGIDIFKMLVDRFDPRGIQISGANLSAS
jgi:hypothetical protein